MLPKIIAYVGITPRGSLADVAALLHDALGVPFHADTTGRYEEYPAYYADALGLHLSLLGVPAPENDLRDNPTKDFTFQVTSRVSGSDGEVDLSTFFVQLIKERAGLACWVLE
jgi:hypothetical protein